MAIRDNNRDVELKISAVVGGTGDVQALAGDIDHLAQSGKSAAPAFDGLAGGIDKLAQDHPEIARLVAELEALAAATVAARAAERDATAQRTATRRSLDEERDALALLRIQTASAGRSTDEYKAKVRGLLLAIHEKRVALRGTTEAVQAAATAARVAAANEKTLADQLERTAAAFRREAAEAAAANRTVGDGLKGLTGQLAALRNIAGLALGGTVVGSLAADLGKTADQYNNLAARIKLATGEGAAFDATFQGVFEIAQRTGTAVKDVGDLFTRLAQAGKALNLTNADALRLTETITQATQLSGASADSAAAAVTQFAQAIASGVLRGDELNSIFEQAPRLTQALADGLGVASGELRKLGEAGQLTATRVIGALQGQSATLQAEFSKLPATIGRSINNLSTSWTRYIGEVDAANGISSKAAAVINTLAANLDTLGAVLYSAGKAAIALKAIDLAKLFYAHATAAAVETAAVQANTAATAANTGAKRANAVATAESAAGAGKFAAAMSAIKVFALVSVLTNLREIGTAIGEGAARWMGYGKAIDQAEAAARREEEATRANAAAKADLAQKLQIAADRALGLDVVSQKLIGDFEQLVAKGESAGDALDKLSKALDLRDLKGIGEAGAALDVLRQKGVLSADQIRESWTKALKGIDLGIFTTQARAAFDGSEQGARRLASALDGALREAIARSGLDFRLISDGTSKAAASASNDLDIIIAGLDKLKAAGVDTGRLLAASITQALDAADSQQALDTLVDKIKAARSALGEKITEGFLDQARQKADELKDSLDRALPGINSLREAYKTLGLQAPEDLTRIAKANKAAWEVIRNDSMASVDTIKQAFATYAESAIAAAGKSRPLTEGILQAEAASKGLAVEFDKAGRVIVKGANEAAAALQKVEEAQVGIVGAVQDEIAAREKSLTLQEQAIDLAQRQAALDERKREVRDLAGNVVAQEMATYLSIVSQLKGLGVADASATRLARDFTDAKGNVPYFDNPGQKKHGHFGDTLSAAVARAASNLLFKSRSGGAAAPAPSGVEPPIRPILPPAALPYTTVNINLEGKRTQIRVAGPGDARALEDVLRQLGEAAGTAA